MDTLCERHLARGSVEIRARFAVRFQEPNVCAALLQRIVPGDLLVMHDTGAHGHAMGCNYNGKLQMAEVLWQGGDKFKVNRRAEMLADHFVTLDYPGLR